MSLTAEQLAGLPDRAEVLDADGHGIGRIRHIFDSDQVGGSTWVSIDDDGRANRPWRFVPLQGARVDGADLRLAYARRVIDSAPEVADHEVIDSTTERRLRAHYGLDAAGGTGPARGMIRSEERMTVGTRVEATERVLVHKYIVTEEVTRTFTLRREEIRVERQPLGGVATPPGTTGAAFTDEVEEIVLYAEEPVISTRVVPREIVRLSKHTVTDEQNVSADLDREQIDLDRTRGQR
jgi:stress response protein YsnF